MEIENLSIKMLKPYPKNAKKHSHTQVKNVAESIKEFGWQQPIVVDDNYTIIIGHCRYEAANMLSLDYVPVCIAKGLNEEKANKLRLLDNKTNESEWDYELLLEQIPDIDFGNYDELDWGLPEEETWGYEETDDDPFDDIEKLDKHYGVPYQGNKSRIADIIINILPSGKRLVDLFGGGGGV